MYFAERPGVANHLYAFTMKVTPGPNCDFEPTMRGAYVPSYVAAPDYRAAIAKAVAVITGMCFAFDELASAASEIRIETWDRYIAQVWPEFADQLPSKDELPSLVEEGAVFFGPFAAF